MKVEVYTDLHCPFCYIGKKRLDKALKTIPQSVEVIYKSYQLMPQAKKEPNRSIYEVQAERKGIFVEEAMENYNKLKEAAKVEGMDWNYDIMVPTNTFDALRVIQFAHTFNKQQAVVSRFFEAFYSEGRDMGDFKTLAALAGEAGLDESKVMEILERGEYGDVVNQQDLNIRASGIPGIPYYIVNDEIEFFGSTSGCDIAATLKNEMDAASEKPAQGPICDDSGVCRLA